MKQMQNDIFYVRVDRTRKIPVTTFIKSNRIKTDDQIIELFGEEEKLKATIQKTNKKTR